MSLIKDPDFIKACWKKGVLKYKLRSEQIPIYNAVWKAIKEKQPSYTVLCSRQIGKSYVDLLIGFEYAIRNPGSSIPFAIPVAANYEEMYIQSINHILSDVPQIEIIKDGKKDLIPDPEIAPVHTPTKKTITFPNQSHIKISGVEGDNYISLRGGPAGVVFVDEAAFMTRLRRTVDDVLFPRTTTTGGTIIQSTTPPTEPDHDFIVYYKTDVEAGRISTFTLLDSTLPDELKQRIIDKYKTKDHPLGITNPTFRREYMCEFVSDETKMIIPEWNDAIKEPNQPHPYVLAYPRDDKYKYFHKYDGMDLGFSQDFTACLFGYYHFLNKQLIIEREFVDLGYKYTTETLSVKLKAIELEIWQEAQPHLRVADCNNLQMIADLGVTYKMPWAVVRKTKTESGMPTETKQGILNGMVNKLRVMIGNGEIIIDPSCVHLIGCLQNGIWDGTKFAHSPTYGHFDGLAALIYMVKVLDTYTNPIPVGLGWSPGTHHINKNLSIQNNNARTLNNLLNPRRKVR